MTDHDQEYIKDNSVFLGADPEFFFQRDGAIIGAEKIFDKEILGIPDNSNLSFNGKIVLDGVQAEMHPGPKSCRAQVGAAFGSIWRGLANHLVNHPGVSINLDPVIDISQAELDSLSPGARELGCQPSLNFYDPSAKVNAPEGLLTRAAGGHIHLGLNTCLLDYMNLRSRLVPLLDIFVGNTCVLLDRHPRGAERRLYYGRAGEHRLPSYGLEYRVLSNFWLQSYPLMSFVMGMARLAVGVLVNDHAKRSQFVVSGVDGWGQSTGKYVSVDPTPWAEDMILSMVSIPAVIKAINTNDFELAWQNYQSLKPFLINHVFPAIPSEDFHYPLHGGNLGIFEALVENGLEWAGRSDPLPHWCAFINATTHRNGWEIWLDRLRGLPIRKAA